MHIIQLQPVRACDESCHLLIELVEPRQTDRGRRDFYAFHPATQHKLNLRDFAFHIEEYRTSGSFEVTSTVSLTARSPQTSAVAAAYRGQHGVLVLLGKSLTLSKPDFGDFSKLPQECIRWQNDLEIGNHFFGERFAC